MRKDWGLVALNSKDAGVVYFYYAKHMSEDAIDSTVTLDRNEIQTITLPNTDDTIIALFQWGSQWIVTQSQTEKKLSVSRYYPSERKLIQGRDGGRDDWPYTIFKVVPMYGNLICLDVMGNVIVIYGRSGKVEKIEENCVSLLNDLG